LRSAEHVFTNRVEDLINLKRIKDKNRLTYVAPGIFPKDFYFDAQSRTELRRHWNTGDQPVVLSAAMFRPGVKTEGLEWVLRTCGKLFRRGRRFQLVIAGDGKEKSRLQKLAETQLPGRVRFAGKIARDKMNRFYSAGDVFAFPGIRESLGMVFLEAQSCGIPVVAFANGGIPEVVKDRETGFLVPPYDSDSFMQSIEKLLINRDLRWNMGQAACSYVRSHHDLNRNYQKMETIIENLLKPEGY
jgi:phosphatidylinositol alpha-1,6-mannosyltransferase